MTTPLAARGHVAHRIPAAPQRAAIPATATPSDPEPSTMVRRPGLALLGGVGLLGSGFGLGEAVVREGAARTGELHLDQVIANDRVGPLSWVAHALDVGFGPLVAPGLLLVVCALVALRNRCAAVVLGLVTVAGWFSVAVGKVVFARPRPPAQLVHALVAETKPDSFPSGHTAFAVALVVGVALALKVSGRPTRWAWGVGLPLATIVAASRLYLGAHYLGDVVGSYLFAGGASLVLVAVLSSRWVSSLGTTWTRAAARRSGRSSDTSSRNVR